MLSALDMFSTGIGPSSSHTVGPMRAAKAFVDGLRASGAFDRTARVRVTLYGSLAQTGVGHGTDRAVVAGWEGALPETVDPRRVLDVMDRCGKAGALLLDGEREIAFAPGDVEFQKWRSLTRHPNGMRFRAFDDAGAQIAEETWYSVGGGFITRGDNHDGVVGGGRADGDGSAIDDRADDDHDAHNRAGLHAGNAAFENHDFQTRANHAADDGEKTVDDERDFHTAATARGAAAGGGIAPTTAHVGDDDGGAVANAAAIDGVRTHISAGAGAGAASETTAAGDGAEANAASGDGDDVPFPFGSGAELLALCAETRRSVAGIMLANEAIHRPEAETTAALRRVWGTMRACVKIGCTTYDTVLPGGLNVPRRAPQLYRKLATESPSVADLFAGDVEAEPTAAHRTLETNASDAEWVDLFAIAVSEENAGGGRVVTAPTNGSAGVIPAVLHYYWWFVNGADERGVIDFLLTAAAIGYLFKRNASISGAEVGCQGEVGAACSMAAAGLCAALGGSPAQIENAAEIGMEHNLGLTCDPIGGLVQIPCIERNAMASNTAINAARMALLGDGSHIVSLDQAIKTMKDTGADMMSKYKETSRGGLAVNVPEC